MWWIQLDKWSDRGKQLTWQAQAERCIKAAGLWDTYYVTPNGIIKRREVMVEGKDKSVKDLILEDLTAAQKSLQSAYIRASQANPMSQDLPVFKSVQQLATEVSAVMQHVAKVRGL